MKNKQTGRRFAAAFRLALLALTVSMLAASSLAPNVAHADDEPDFLILNPDRE